MSHRVVAGDFNARIGDVLTPTLDDDMLHILPASNRDQGLNDGRAPFLAFVDLCDLTILNGHFSLENNAPDPADFTFFSIREHTQPDGTSCFITARSCIDYILVDTTTFRRITSFSSLFFLHVDHCLLSTSFPLLPSQLPPAHDTNITLQKFVPPSPEDHAAIFANFSLGSVPPLSHPMTHLVTLIHAAGSWKPLAAPRNWFETPQTVEQAQHVASLRRQARHLYVSLLKGGPSPPFKDFIDRRAAWIRALDNSRKLSTVSFQSIMNEWKCHPAVPGNASKLWRILTGKKIRLR